MSGLIYAVDAGSAQSAFVLFDPALQRIVDLGIDTNEPLLKQILLCPPRIAVFAYERLVPYGFTVGKEVFDTIEWNGRFRQAAERVESVAVFPVTRKQCMAWHTGKATGGDPQIRAAMIARFGKENLQGCKTHIWSALAIAAFASDNLPSGGAGLATTDSPSRSEPKNKALTALPAQSLSSVSVLTDPNPNANDAVRRRIDQRVVIARESTEPKPNCVKGATDSRGGLKPLTSGGDKKDFRRLTPTDPSRVKQTGVRSRGGVLPARFSGEVSETSSVKRRRCVACGLMTEHWQRINGGSWHCYDGCRSTTGRDRRVQPQALQPS